MKAKIFISISTILIVMATAMASDNKGLEIAKLVDNANSGWKTEQVISEMILVSSDGREVKREIRTRGIEVEGDGDKTLVIFDKPRDVKGTVFLTHAHKSGDDDQWLFLPALKRVKRISSSNRSGPFMGSEFAYEDISSEEIERYKYKFIKEDVCFPEKSIDIPKCNIFERYPVDKNSGYSKQIVYSDMEFHRIMKIEYFDRKKSHQKTLIKSEFKKYGNFWRADIWLMVNLLNNKKTKIHWKDRKFNIDLSERDFDQSSMKRLR